MQAHIRASKTNGYQPHMAAVGVSAVVGVMAIVGVTAVVGNMNSSSRNIMGSGSASKDAAHLRTCIPTPTSAHLRTAPILPAEVLVALARQHACASASHTSTHARTHALRRARTCTHSSNNVHLLHAHAYATAGMGMYAQQPGPHPQKLGPHLQTLNPPPVQQWSARWQRVGKCVWRTRRH